MVSNSRHLQLHDSLLETKRHGLVIVNVPNPFGAIPFTACPFNTALQVSFLEFNPQSDNGWLLRRRLGGFSNNDFDGCEAFAPLLVVAIADANQLLAITVEEFLCAFPIGNQCPSSLHKHPA